MKFERYLITYKQARDLGAEFPAALDSLLSSGLGEIYKLCLIQADGQVGHVGITVHVPYEPFEQSFKAQLIKEWKEKL